MRPTEFMAAVAKRALKPAYFLRGPERLLRDECRAALIQAVPEQARAWSVSEVEFRPGRLAQELEGASQVPMLGDRSHLIVSDADDFSGATEQDTEALAAYLARPSVWTTAIFIAPEADRRRRFIQLLEKSAEVVELTPLGRLEAAEWLIRYAGAQGVRLTAALAEEIAARFERHPDWRGSRGASGVNLVWMRTEFGKLLAAYPEAKRIELRQLEALVSFREEHEIGRLLAAIAAREAATALAYLRVLLASGEPELLILWWIGDLFRQALKSRLPGQAVWSRSPLSTFELGPRARRSYSPTELRHALRQVRNADLAVKSSWKDSRILLETLVWQLVSRCGRHLAAAPSDPPAMIS